ncbi:Metallo-dependent phosphatase-like protein [Lipomyces kononenkoae]|uniref:Metallo-dependent phosphatase-like protein n=1 Tax=Lipomyces kononenkoae TaxID=34357 RepID=A0ACC3SVH3_LIPKO
MRRRQPPLSLAVTLTTCLTTRTVQFLAICFSVFVALPLAIYTFYYPLFKSDLCNWPSASYKNPRDLRLLLFGDPQIRGASSSASLRTQLDIFGNDHYLGHIYSTLVARLDPTHVIVAGDLFSSQWISDEEFDVRVRRYKNRIFRHRGTKVTPAPLLLNLPGNHDIGYAHDVIDTRVRRFENNFGQLNFVVKDGDFRIVVFNSMSLDGSLDDNEHGQASFTRDVRTFLEEQMKVNFDGTTILATHVPLYKPAGVCIDKPYFSYYRDKSARLIREQNMLSEETSQWLLDGFFGVGRAGRGVIINGHDHDGCLVRHTKVQGEQRWGLVPIASGDSKYKYYYNEDSSDSNGVLEVTLRSMQGQYGGNAGLLKGAWDSTTQGYEFSFSICRFGVQHIWWATYVMAIIAACANVIAFIGLPFLNEKARRAFIAGTMTPPVSSSRAFNYKSTRKSAMPISPPISGRQSPVNFLLAGAKPEKVD